MKAGGRWLLPGLLLLAGCAGGSSTSGEIPVKVVTEGPYCGDDKAGVTVIADAAAWGDASPATEIGAPADSPPVDFTRAVLVRIGMGQRPTAGYGLTLARDRAGHRDGTAVIRVRWRQPEPDALQAQVVTQPCLLVRLPRAGIGRVRVVDEAGTVRGKAVVPPAGEEGGQ